MGNMVVHKRYNIWTIGTSNDSLQNIFNSAILFVG